MSTAAQKPYVFILDYMTEEGGQFPGNPFGVFSTLEAAQVEAVRHNHRKPLEWKECTTDKPFVAYWFAPLHTWRSEGVRAEIWKVRLDAKHFRP